jgi:hypothetical protein
MKNMARQMIDIGLEDSEDLNVASGDFTLIESTAQHQQQLILNNKGDFKQNPVICVGAFDYLDDENFQGLIRGISVEFNRDGMDVKSIQISSDGVIVSDAFYK